MSMESVLLFQLSTSALSYFSDSLAYSFHKLVEVSLYPEAFTGPREEGNLINIERTNLHGLASVQACRSRLPEELWFDT